MRVRHGWALVPAFVLAVVILGPLVGFVLDRFLYRYLRTAPEIARLVTSLGLLVAGPSIVQLWFGSSSAFGPPSIWPHPDAFYRFGQYALDANQMATLVFTVVAVLGLMALFRWSAIGLQMRAVVESPRMTELAGINADRVSTFSWMLSSLFAGLAGVLLAPLFAQVAANNFTTLLVAAVAAAAFGRLTSIPMTLLGGLLLGVVQGLLTGLVYGLMALGLSVIFGVVRVVNFAHGELTVVAMYSAFLLFQTLGLDPLLASIPIAAVFFGLGYLLQSLLINPFIGRPEHGCREEDGNKQSRGQPGWRDRAERASHPPPSEERSTTTP